MKVVDTFPYNSKLTHMANSFPISLPPHPQPTTTPPPPQKKKKTKKLHSLFFLKINQPPYLDACQDFFQVV